MSKTLRWVFVLLPCTPGLLMLLAGLVLVAAPPTPDPTPETVERDERDARRAEQLFTAGGAVLLAGLGMGGFVAWRIAHPRPEGDEEDEGGHPPAS